MRKKFWTIQIFSSKNKKPRKKGEIAVGEFVIATFALILVVAFGFAIYHFNWQLFSNKKDKIESSKPRLEENNFQDLTKDWQIYDNQNFNYQVKVPFEYQKEDLLSGSGADFNHNEVKIYIFAQKNESGETINSYLENKQIELEAKDKKTKMAEKRNESLSGQTALSETWTYHDVSNHDRDMAWKRLVAAAAGSIYIFDFSAPIKTFEENQKNFDLVIQSLRIF
jgi:hypothetical protein